MSLISAEGGGPFSINRMRPPWQGVWAAPAINTRGMRSLERRRPLLRANPLSHRVAAFFQRRVYIALQRHFL